MPKKNRKDKRMMPRQEKNLRGDAFIMMTISLFAGAYSLSFLPDFVENNLGLGGVFKESRQFFARVFVAISAVLHVLFLPALPDIAFAAIIEQL
jgi:hypothetical protein